MGCVSLLVVPAGVAPGLSSGRFCGGRWGDAGDAGRGPVALCVDEVGEPVDLALDRLDPVALELPGLPVDLLLRHVQLALDPVEPLLEPHPASLEHAQPD